MKRLQFGTLLLLAGLLLLALAQPAVLAQPATPSPTPTLTPTPAGPVRYRVPVRVESAFVRAEPSLEAEAVASVFLDEPLEVVGRNADGLWFEVRRPGRLTNLGWIFNEMLDWEFDVTTLPLTNTTTGLLGPTPPEDTGFAVFMLAEAILRDAPQRGSEITRVPFNVVVPVIYRNQDASALQINYLGFVGWISVLTFREPPNVFAIPVAPGLPPLPGGNTVIIPVEVQLEQIFRLREFVTVSRELADQLASFWYDVYQGQIMPCEAPPFVLAYPYTAADVQQLPELDRYVPRVNEAVRFMNAAIDPLTICGVFQPNIVIDARNDAINARIIFDANLQQLDNLEEIVRSLG